MLMAVSFTRPDPLLLTIALAERTRSIRFMVACRSGLISPTYFVQQINTVSLLCGGRVCLNIVCGHTPEELKYYGDFLSHDERYERTDEFLRICRSFWNGPGEVDFDGRYFRIVKGRLMTPFKVGQGSPEIFLSGNSRKAAELAVAHACCQWRIAAEPSALVPQVEPVLRRGTEVGLLVSVIARPTRSDAIEAAEALIAGLGSDSRAVHEILAEQSDSVGFTSTYRSAEEASSRWLSPTLWTGAVPYLGPPAICLVGSYPEVAGALIEYGRIGISQFLLMGRPAAREMKHFGNGVLPLVRSQEQAMFPASAIS